MRMLRYLEGQFAEKVMGMDSIQGTQTQACHHAAAYQQDQDSGSELRHAQEGLWGLKEQM